MEPTKKNRTDRFRICLENFGRKNDQRLGFQQLTVTSVSLCELYACIVSMTTRHKGHEENTEVLA